MRRAAKNALIGVSTRIQRNLRELTAPPLEGAKPDAELVVDSDLLSGTRPYLEKVAIQINGTYENGWYDACAVMLRRFIETLIIEAYIGKNLEQHIKNGNGNFFNLQKLIDEASGGNHLNLSRESKRVLRKLKTLGDRSAHNRTFVAKRTYFDNLFVDIFLDMQMLIQELLNEAGL